MDDWRPSERRFLDIIDDPFYRLLADLQDLLLTESVRFWSPRSVRYMNFPITTDSVSSPMGKGSDSVPVAVDLHGKRTYLADSMQFMLEYGCRFSESGAWYVMPSFRGEQADATHLNQFYHSEAEIPGGLDEVMAAVEGYVLALTRAADALLGDRVEATAGTRDHIRSMLVMDTFPKMTFDEAAAHLGDDPRFVEHHDGWRTLTRAGEQRLLADVSPVLWVTRYDHLSVPFYQAYDGDSKDKALNADLLFGIGEVVGCGERHVDGKNVRLALDHHEVGVGDYEWYVRMKDEHPLHTSGFGLGIERWLMWLLGCQDIRDLQLVPRLNGVSLQP